MKQHNLIAKKFKIDYFLLSKIDELCLTVKKQGFEELTRMQACSILSYKGYETFKKESSYFKKQYSSGQLNLEDKVFLRANGNFNPKTIETVDNFKNYLGNNFSWEDSFYILLEKGYDFFLKNGFFQNNLILDCFSKN
jgi:hypothetical protein